MSPDVNHPQYDPAAEAAAHADRMNPPSGDGRGRRPLTDLTDPAQNARHQIRTAIDTLADALAEHAPHFDPDQVADDLLPLHVVLDRLYKGWLVIPGNAKRVNDEIATREHDAIAAGLISRPGERLPEPGLDAPLGSQGAADSVADVLAQTSAGEPVAGAAALPEAAAEGTEGEGTGTSQAAEAPHKAEHKGQGARAQQGRAKEVRSGLRDG